MLTPQDILERLRHAGYYHVAFETDGLGRTVFVFTVGHQVKLSNWGAFNRKLKRVGLTCGGTSIGADGMMHRMEIHGLPE